MPRKVRDYKDEYANYASKPENRKRHAARNKARRDYEKVHGDLPSTVDLDHVKPLSKGGSMALSNVRPVSQRQNRSFPRTKTGAIKAAGRSAKK